MRYALLLLALTIGCFVPSAEFSPLVEATRAGNVAEVRALAAKGADLNEPSGGNDWTPLLHAVHKSQYDAAAALLDAGAMVDRADGGGTTPLMMAAAYDNKEMVALLLRRGASAKLTDKDGKTALDHAVVGTSDVDRMTFFSCNQETTRLLASVSPAPRARSQRWAKAKGCA